MPTTADRSCLYRTPIFFRKQIYRNPNPLPSGFGFGFLLLVTGNEKDATATF
nr:MAG TPA: hypothetical protein [Caudoviricetes sp.]